MKPHLTHFLYCLILEAIVEFYIEELLTKHYRNHLSLSDK